MGRTGFQVTSDRIGDRVPLPLYDVASAGLSIVVSARNNLKVGEGFSATLHVPGCEPVACQLELRNLRPFPGDPGRKLAGCRFADLADVDRERISSALAKRD